MNMATVCTYAPAWLTPAACAELAALISLIK
jgi:hypothetical protein